MSFVPRSMASAGVLVLALGGLASAEEPGKPAAPGLAWVGTWEKAQEQAFREHKLVLHFSLIGNLDKPDC